MITASFRRTAKGSYKSFRISGHSGYADPGEDIVCASVSSAVMLTINTASEYFSIPLNLKVKDGDITCGIKEVSQNSDRLVESLRIHLDELAGNFPENMKVNITEV